MQHVLLYQGLQFPFHVPDGSGMLCLEVVSQDGVLAVGVEAGDLLPVKLDEPVTLVVHVHAVL